VDHNEFSALPLRSDLIKSVSSLGYCKMTPIQTKALPYILKGLDVIGEGTTGSGKTVAFSLGLLNKLDLKEFKIQALVLCPTRELANQIAEEIRKLARTTYNTKVLILCGGSPFGPQKGSLGHGAHIVVGTPGRILDHLNKNNLSLKHINTFVLDEADRMLDMGFQASLNAIIEELPKDRQTLLFSATFEKSVLSISKEVMRDPKVIKVTPRDGESKINQIYYHVKDEKNRIHALKLILFKYRPKSTIIFCETKKESVVIADFLIDLGLSALPIHGDLDQKDRDQTLVCFSNNSLSILVATDVASRGIDISLLSAVINYKLARDINSHVHRIGRTGRMGASGEVYNLYTEKEQYKIKLLERSFNQIILSKDLPSIDVLSNKLFKPLMKTLQIDGGKKQKVRAGDILGALTGNGGIEADRVGDIKIKDNWSYVAVDTNFHQKALKKLSMGRIKGKNFRIRLIDKN